MHTIIGQLLLSQVFAKAMDKVIGNQLMSLLDILNVFIKSQFGFRKDKSIKDAIVTTFENMIENLNNETKCSCVLLDL
jgi:hypothetical protein